MSSVAHSVPGLRRLIVALGGRPRDEAALLLAARLAQGANAELSGLFLEDAELLEVASLPVTALVVQTTERRRLDMVSVERGFRVEARRLRRLVASVSERHTVRWSFGVRRIRTCEEIARQLEGDEWLVMAPQGRIERRRRLGEVMACEVSPPILILEPGHRRPRGHLAILYEGGEDVLRAASNLAGVLESGISVIPVSGMQNAPLADEKILRDWSGNLAMPAGIAAPVRGDLESVRAALNHVDPDIVVIGRGGRAAGFGLDALDELCGPRAVLVPGRERRSPASGT